MPSPHIGEEQRLSATLVLSLLIHGVVILGIGFALDDAAPMVPTLDVIFSQTSTPLTPAQADFLAQANNQGGGEHDQSRRPRDNQVGIAPTLESGQAPHRMSARSMPETSPPEARVITSRSGDETASYPKPQQSESTDSLPNADGDSPIDAEIARLSAEIDMRSELYARRPVRKFVSASTREYAYANYLRAWVDRVERVGNLNYPDEARRRRLGGQVIISVAVRSDGSVESSRILRSSGTPLLDDSALRIVQLAQPFPALPKTDENVDVLHITRTWVFLPGGKMEDR
ncbi:MAG: energy transducer TonB [Xanthomonadaceae bacterium]|nr:energy transducer TonB [Xanthomonadaceae bacterium]